MKAGLSLTQLAKELDRQKDAKRDFLVDTRDLTLLAVPGSEDAGYSGLELSLPGVGEYEMRAGGALINRQIGDYIKMPGRYWDMLQESHPTLLAHSVNTLFRERDPARRMIRAFDYGDGDGGRYARAFLSDRYLRRDNYEVAGAALRVAQEIPDVQVKSSDVTDRNMYLTLVAPRVQGEVKKGDVIQAGLRLRNSEVGWGALSVEPILYRLWCDNGCGTWDSTRVFRITHAGPQIDSDETLRVLSDETLRKDDEAFFAKLADVMRAAVDETIFNDAMTQMRLAAESKKMVKPKEALEELGQKFDLGESEQDGILAHLIEGGDLTGYGALNAVTRYAQDVESYDRSMELEAVGGKMLKLATTREWERIATEPRPATRKKEAVAA